MFYWLSQHIIYCTYHIHFQTHLCFGKKVRLSSTHRTMIAQYSERPAVKRTTSAITTISFHLAWHKYKHVPIAIQLFQESKSSCDWWINHDEFMLPWKVLFVLVRWSSNLYLANKALIDLKLLTWDEGHLQSSDALPKKGDGYASIMILQRELEILQIKMVLKKKSKFQKNPWKLGKTRHHVANCQTNESKVITGASSVMSFSSASFCDSAWNGTIASHGAQNAGNRRWVSKWSTRRRLSVIPYCKWVLRYFSFHYDEVLPGRFDDPQCDHACTAVSLSLSLCTEELPTALEIKLSPQRKLPNNRPGFMWPWSASNIQLLAMLNAETRTSLQETSGIGILQSLEFGTVPDSHTCHHAIMSYCWMESQQNHPCLSSQILIQHFLAESRKLSSCQPIYA